MKYTYKIVKGSFDNDLLKRTDENGNEFWIPMDESNSDYQAYLRWLDDPNAPTAFPHQPLVEG